MATDPREALIGIVLDALASDECSYTAAEQAADRIRAWTMEPAQVEQAAKGAYYAEPGPEDDTWEGTRSDVRDAYKAEQRAALTALFGGSDGK